MSGKHHSVEAKALAALQRGEHHAAHLLLAAELDRNPKREDLAMILRMVSTCPMIEEAKEHLQRLVIGEITMSDSIQSDLFEPTIAQRFEAWKATAGGAQILCRFYRITAAYYGRWKTTRQPVSQRLLWETLRDRVDGIRRELKRRGIRLECERGFLLNDHFTAYAVRHMIAEHPEWKVLFELREVGKPRKVKRTTIVKEEVLAA
jgi:hypothetical protein